jgi:hypothetical protein
VDERAQQSGSGEFFEVSAGLRETAADALDGAHQEAASDEGIQSDIARHDVPSRLFPGEIYLVENLRLDQRQFVAAARSTERAMACRVSVALKPAAGYRERFVDPDKRPFRLRG